MAFSGFPKSTITFLSALGKNNHKAWFDDHRADYEASFVEPAKLFIEALAPRLRALDPTVHAEPRVNGSIMRINRDIRFSKDKTPYKDHLDLWCWCGDEKGWDAGGFFFRVTATQLMVGTGMHAFAPAGLARYRDAVLDPKKGEALRRAVEKVRAAGYVVGGLTFKKPPKGVAADHPRAELLKHSGLHAEWEGEHPRELHTAALVDFAVAHLTALLPIHAWLAKL